MTPRDIALLRIRNQLIDNGSNSITPLQTVAHMGAMQAQDYAGSLWSIGLRCGCTQEQVVTAIQNTEILRTWPQRGTIHFVLPQDAAWMVNLSAERLLRGAKQRREQLALDDQVLQTSQSAVVAALRNGGPQTRGAIMDILEQAGVSTAGQRGYHILWYLAQTGVTYIGPMDGKQQTVALLDDITTDPRQLSRPQSIAELAQRYFVSHGPATLQDFMWWSGLTSADAKAGLSANRALLVSEQVDGREYWLPKNSRDSDLSVMASYLLPGFDEYVLGYKDRSAILDAEHTQKIVPGNNGMFMPTIVIDGKIVGTWKRQIKKDHVSVTLSPFSKLSHAQKKSLHKPLKAYGYFHQLPVKLEP